MIASVDSLLRQRIAWLEALQNRRKEHVEKLQFLIFKKQLEIDNLRARLPE